MKKILAAACICSVLLCGCQSQTAYLKPYTVVTASKTADAASMLNIEAWEGFAENLGVVSVEDSENGINQETLSQLDAKEIFLTAQRIRRSSRRRIFIHRCRRPALLRF